MVETGVGQRQAVRARGRASRERGVSAPVEHDRQRAFDRRAGEAAGVSYVPDQPESGYLKILYEGGILGTLATLLIIGASLRRAVAALASRSTGLDQRSEVIAALAGLAAFASTFTTLFTATDPRLLALLAILLAVVWRSSLPPAPSPK